MTEFQVKSRTWTGVNPEKPKVKSLTQQKVWKPVGGLRVEGRVWRLEEMGWMGLGLGRMNLQPKAQSLLYPFGIEPEPKAPELGSALPPGLSSLLVFRTQSYSKNFTADS